MLFLLGLALAAASTAPTTAMPTGSPTPPTTTAPSMVPTTAVPTSTPTSAAPNTVVPSTQPTSSPSVAPTSSWQNIPLETLEANLTCGLPSASYRQFDKMSPPLCIVIDDKSYLVFYPQVDEFTLLEVQDSFNSTWLDNPQGAPVYVRAEVGKRSSYWRARSQGTGAGKLTVPFWTLVIELADGQVTSLTWDDSCSLCATSDLCVDDLNCGVEHTSCGQSADANNCNLQIYIAWFGTDVDGKYLTSSDKRLSRFRSGSLRGAYDSALKKANNIAEIANPLGTFTGR